MKQFLARKVVFSVRCVMVLIACLAFLLFVLMPCFERFIFMQRQVRAQTRARDLGFALKTYANEHEGKFPTGETAAEALSQILSGGYVRGEDNELFIYPKRKFFLEGSAYTPGTFDTSPNNPKSLQPGENHWAYMSGITDEGSGRWPLLFDGPASKDGRYSADPRKLGGAFGGKTAILVRLDGSAHAEQLKDLFISSDGMDNILKPTPKWTPGGKLLMPY